MNLPADAAFARVSSAVGPDFVPLLQGHGLSMNQVTAIWLPSRNAFAEPMITSAFTAGSAPAFLMPSMMPGRSTLPRPLTGGLFRVMTATLPRTS